MEDKSIAEQSKIKNGILILGVERSGTSLTANIVSGWGATGGWRTSGSGDEHNPNGYFEDEFAEELLAFGLQFVFNQHGSQVGWESTLDLHLREIQHNNFVKTKMLSFLKEISENNKIWFWKSPFLSITEMLWSEYIEDPVILVPVRNPIDNIESIIKLRDLPSNNAVRSQLFLFWQHFLQRSLTVASKSKKVIFIQYERMIENPAYEVKRLISFVEQYFAKKPENSHSIEEIVTTIDTKLHRNNSMLDPETYDLLTETQIHLYQQLVLLASDQTQMNKVHLDSFCLSDDEKNLLKENDTTVFLD